ncbi:type VI secretion system baseplate subunit TssG [Rheinheimera salexigens]|uniref:Type VI secretion protein n=1 Tax=Rheinheimera salexigens TaxID=1628148 RepID=A0A1E7Q6N2_9GAMM|nr:type VI secretion system baseplate subunit TssG [Rheinheimera salexigens]OEY69733.1 type VI secretion protein [Rheinheimera salexigens]
MSIKQLQQSPSDFDFYQAVYSVERQYSSEQKRWQGVGRDGFPRQELIRFKSVQHLGFPGQPISKVETRHAEPEQATSINMHVSFFGLTGPSGVLPQHYTELVIDRVKQRDNTMRDFFDVFNHRLISLYYRAWEKYRFACQYEMMPAQQDSFSKVLTTLSGARSELGLYFAGAFSQQNRNAKQLTAMLSQLLAVDVALEPLQGRWLRLDTADQTALASSIRPTGLNARLGDSAMLGSRVWDISSGVELLLSAKQQQAAELLPGSYKNQLMHSLLAEYLPNGYNVRVTLSAPNKAFTAVKLGQSGLSLGKGSCLSVRETQLQKVTRFSYQLTGS